ncbi:MAG: fructose bisphosphate aldolase [Micrococcaceae bacterium]
MDNNEMLNRFENAKGFFAALDQSGGSTPKALKAYGIDESQYSNDEQMFDLIQQARARIITSPAFTNEHIIAAILFEDTLKRNIDEVPTTQYLWKEKGIIPLLKIDKGLEEEANGVQLMKDIPDLENTLANAKELGVFGTKERSVINSANTAGIKQIVEQQFEIGQQVLSAGMMPVLEPEVTISSDDRAETEKILKQEILNNLEQLGNQKVALKLSIPVEAGFYTELIQHPNVSRVVALSGGYSRDEADELLAKNPGLIASFSRALLEGLSANQSEEDFNNTLNESIQEIYKASNT